MASGSVPFFRCMRPRRSLRWRGASRSSAFDSVWNGDRVSFHNPIYESLTLLAAYAGITRRIKLGSAVYLLALAIPRWRPRSPGRSTRCRAAGSSSASAWAGKTRGFRGLRHSAPRTRRPRGAGGHRGGGALWRDSPATFGRFTQFEGVSIDPKPVQRRAPHLDRGAVRRRAGARGAAGGRLGVLCRAARSLPAEPRQDPHGGRGSRSILDGFVAAHLTFITVGRDYESAERRWVERLSRRYAQDFGPLARKYGVIGAPRAMPRATRSLRRGGLRLFSDESDR